MDMRGDEPGGGGGGVPALKDALGPPLGPENDERG